MDKDRGKYRIGDKDRDRIGDKDRKLDRIVGIRIEDKEFNRE